MKFVFVSLFFILPEVTVADGRAAMISKSSHAKGPCSVALHVKGTRLLPESKQAKFVNSLIGAYGYQVTASEASHRLDIAIVNSYGGASECPMNDTMEMICDSELMLDKKSINRGQVLFCASSDAEMDIFVEKQNAGDLGWDCNAITKAAIPNCN